MALTAMGALLSLHSIAGMPDALKEVFRETGMQWDRLTLGKFWMCFRALILPTLFMGATFPLAVRALGAGRERLGRDVGRLYAANTFGGVLGAAAGGFLLIPTLGTHGGIVGLSAMLAVVGVALFASDSSMLVSSRAQGLAALLTLLFMGWQVIPDDVNAALNQGYVWADQDRKSVV